MELQHEDNSPDNKVSSRSSGDGVTAKVIDWFRIQEQRHIMSYFIPVSHQNDDMIPVSMDEEQSSTSLLESSEVSPRDIEMMMMTMVIPDDDGEEDQYNSERC
jgi:hypothetical protein